MVHDSCYGDECRGTAIRLNKADDFSKLVEDIGDFQFSKSPDGSRVGIAKDDRTCEAGEIPEDCTSSINGMWSLNAIDPEPVQNIIAHVADFADKNRDKINKVYKHAETRGAYQKVTDVYKLSSILDTYEEYFNDLTQFIKARLDDTGGANCVVNTATATIKALDIDEKFFSDMFAEKCSLTYSGATVETCNAIMTFSSFLYSVYDNFISVRGACGDNGATVEDLSIINVYGYSVSRFVKRFFCELEKNFNTLVTHMSGYVPSVSMDKTRDYVLL